MKYLIAVLAAWILAQCMKHLFRLAGKNRRIFNNNPSHIIMLSGGMPSAHAASVTALTVMIGLIDGVSSGLFALSVLFSSVVMYDAMMVRYSSGQQGDLLNRLIVETKSKLGLVRVAHGHRVIEVVAGSIVGAALAFIVFFTTI